MNITGKGVVIAVVDDGIEYTHPDLEPNYAPECSFDFNYNDADPFPDANSDDHGTSASGVAAARDNNVCGVGSAPRARLSGIRVISKSSTDSQEAGSLSYKYDCNDIYSNSWGPIDDGKRKEGPGRLATAAIANGVKLGRHGKGSIFVWAGGNGRRNGDNCNYDGWANSRYTISIAAVDFNGLQSWYSESCSMLVVSAPSSGDRRAITTTDLLGRRGTSGSECTSGFGGTSAAAPLAAGAIALILEANPELGWRDVQGVLIETATQNHPGDGDWKQNGAGHFVNHKYGYGLLNAFAAVQAAQTWHNYGPELAANYTNSTSIEIPDTSLPILFTVDVTETFILENVDLVFTANHPRRGDLKIVLQSPLGTQSVLAEVHPDMGASYNWRFGSNRCWGEIPAGVWTLKVSDERAGYFGTVLGWTLNLYGHSSPVQS